MMGSCLFLLAFFFSVSMSHFNDTGAMRYGMISPDCKVVLILCTYL